ncbi:MAG: hypothetical protein HYX84_08345 [Chloroflexi bacterium]|nr:hypothetical protein [Chloroflexota bacterium]
MKRVVLSDTQIEQILQLRKSGLNWVKIQGKTGIPRRIARREYEEVEKKQSQRQLESARKDVAIREYQAHLDILSHFAANLVDALAAPQQVANLGSADEVEQGFLSNDIYREYELVGLRLGDYQREKRVLNMNILLFKSLRDHTRGKIDWQTFDDWKVARDNCIKELETLKKEVVPALDNVLQRKSQLKKTLDAADDPRALDRMREGIILNLWLNDILGEKGTVMASKGISALKKGTAWVDFHQDASEDTRITFDSADQRTNSDLAAGVAELCKQAIFNLRATKTVTAFVKEAGRMQEAAAKLETTLNPLFLRPIILNTRCEICPV